MRSASPAPGMMNIQRVLLRSFRLAWLGFAAASAALVLSSALRSVDLSNFALSVCWLATVYFASCSPSPPVVRTFRRGLPCLARAG